MRGISDRRNLGAISDRRNLGAWISGAGESRRVEFWRMMRRESQRRISAPMCARIPPPCAETLETPLKLKKVIYFQHVEFCHVEFWRIYVPELHVTEIHVPRLSYAVQEPPPPWAHYRGKAATNKLFPRHSLPSPPPPIKPWMAAKFRLVTRHLLINSCLCFWKGSKCHDSKQLRILFSCLGKLCSNKCQKLWN